MPPNKKKKEKEMKRQDGQKIRKEMKTKEKRRLAQKKNKKQRIKKRIKIKSPRESPVNL